MEMGLEKKDEIQVVDQDKEIIAMAIKYMDLTGLAKDLSANEKEMFLMHAKSQKLNPFNKELHAIVYYKNDPTKRTVSFITGYEAYLRRVPTQALDGWECNAIYTDKALVGAEIIIHVKGWDHPFKHRVVFKEYNTGKNLWVSKPETMTKKVCTAQGFRLCFPKEYEGMPYIAEEIEGGNIKELNENEKDNIRESNQKYGEYVIVIKAIYKIMHDDDKARHVNNVKNYKMGRLSYEMIESEIEYFKENYNQFFQEKEGEEK